MKLSGFIILLLTVSNAWAGGNLVTYQVNGVDYEGYFVSPDDDSPLVLLIHGWDGPTDYEIRRAEMLAVMGYLVFATDTAITTDQFADLANQLESAGIRHEMVTYSGAPLAFTVFGSPRYRADADARSWKLFGEFLAEVSR